MQDYPEIYLKDLSLVIGRQVILRGINTRFTGGKIYGLIGHNGSGKTMLMKCICGFVRPTAGGVRINGKWLGLEQDFPESLGALIEAPGFLPYYTGSGRHSSFAVTAGPVHRLWRGVNLFYGAGYGRTATAWQLDDSEGGGYALNNGLTHSGLAAEAGVALSFGHFCITASAVTIGGRHWQGCVGIGVALFKGKKVKK